MNLEELISFETAKLAKEKGFKKLCGFSYDEDGILTGNCEQSYNYVAPTQSLLQKWLREKYKIHIVVYVMENSDGNIYYDFGLKRIVNYLSDNSSKPMKFSTYEKALEVGLQEALKLI